MQNLSLKNWPYQKPAAVDALTMHQHCHYSELANPLEFLLGWDNLPEHRTSQQQLWHTMVETYKPARSATLLCGLRQVHRVQKCTLAASDNSTTSKILR